MWTFYQKSNVNLCYLSNGIYLDILNRINYWVFTLWLIQLMDTWIKNLCSKDNEKDIILLRILTGGMTIIFSLYWGFPILTFICYFFTCGLYPWVTSAILIFLWRSWIVTWYLTLQEIVYGKNSTHFKESILSFGQKLMSLMICCTEMASNWSCSTKFSSLMSESANLTFQIIKNAYFWFMGCLKLAGRTEKFTLKEGQTGVEADEAHYQKRQRGILRLSNTGTNNFVYENRNINVNTEEQRTRGVNEPAERTVIFALEEGQTGVEAHEAHYQKRQRGILSLSNTGTNNVVYENGNVNVNTEEQRSRGVNEPAERTVKFALEGGQTGVEAAEAHYQKRQRGILRLSNTGTNNVVCENGSINVNNEEQRISGVNEEVNFNTIPKVIDEDSGQEQNIPTNNFQEEQGSYDLRSRAVPKRRRRKPLIWHKPKSRKTTRKTAGNESDKDEDEIQD